MYNSWRYCAIHNFASWYIAPLSTCSGPLARWRRAVSRRPEPRAVSSPGRATGIAGADRPLHPHKSRPDIERFADILSDAMKLTRTARTCQAGWRNHLVIAWQLGQGADIARWAGAGAMREPLARLIVVGWRRHGGKVIKIQGDPVSEVLSGRGVLDRRDLAAVTVARVFPGPVGDMIRGFTVLSPDSSSFEIRMPRRTVPDESTYGTLLTSRFRQRVATQRERGKKA